MVQVKDIVGEYLEISQLTLRGFSDALVENLHGDLSHATIINWRDGKSEPDTDFLCLVLMRYRDWRFDFALKCLAAKKPEVWGEGGGIWDVTRRLVCGESEPVV